MLSLISAAVNTAFDPSWWVAWSQVPSEYAIVVPVEASSPSIVIPSFVAETVPIPSVIYSERLP